MCFFWIEFRRELDIAQSYILCTLSLTGLIKGELEEGCDEEKKDTEFKDDMHREVLEEDSDDNDVQWDTEEVHSS